MNQRTTRRWLWPLGMLVFIAVGARDLSVVRADTLVDIDLVSQKRRYGPDRPVDLVEQPFAVPGVGILTIEYQTDPYQGHVLGGYSIAAADGSPLNLGHTVSHQLTPDPWVEGAPGKLQDVILVPKGLQALKASLAAWHVGDAMQVLHMGTQLPAAQRLTVSFLSANEYKDQAGSPPAVDISGAWGDTGFIGGADLIFVPKGEGTYDLAGRYTGTARVSGRIVTVDYTYVGSDGKPVKGLWIFEVDAANPDHMTGAWVENGQSGTSDKSRSDPRGLDATPFKGRVGERFTFKCPPGLVPGGVWGTDLYTADSKICAAAVHAGAISAEAGGEVTIEIRGGSDSYVGSERNGVATGAYGPYDSSYVFVGAGGSTGASSGEDGARSGSGDAASDPGRSGGAGGVLDPAKVTRMTLQAGRRRVVAGQSVTIPIWLLRAADVANMNFELGYDADVVAAPGGFSKGNMLGGALFEVNPKEAGTVRVGFAGNQDLVGDGTVAHLVFTATGAAGSRSDLKLKVTTLAGSSGQAPMIATIDGLIEVVGPDGIQPGDVDGDGQFTARDAGEALKMSVRLIPENKVCDVDRDGQVTSTDARLILAKVTGKP